MPTCDSFSLIVSDNLTRELLRRARTPNTLGNNLWCHLAIPPFLYLSWDLNMSKGPFILHPNCVAVPIYQLHLWCKSPQHHRISSQNEFNFHATPQCSNIECVRSAVTQGNCCVVWMDLNCCVIYTRNSETRMTKISKKN